MLPLLTFYKDSNPARNSVFTDYTNPPMIRTLVDTGGFEPHLSLCKSDAFPVKLPTHVRPSPHFNSRHILSIVLLDYKVKCLILLAILQMVAKTGFEPVKHTKKYNCCICLSPTGWSRTSDLTVISRVLLPAELPSDNRIK